MKKQIATAMIGLGVVLGLAACSGAEGTPSASPTPTRTAAAHVNVHNECDDDGYLDIAGSDREEFGSCRIVSLINDEREVTVGDADELYFEGSGNTIHAESVGIVDFLTTSGNTLEYTGEAPEVRNQGDNVVTAAS